jgi:hypothetical protein
MRRPDRRRLLPSLALAGCAVLVSVVGFSGPAGAAAPIQQGWWASTNPGGLPAQPPAPPDVPADGLLVQAGPSGPSAYAALAYDLEPGSAPGALTLRVDGNGVSSPSATLVLCALKDASFSAAQGGPMADAPAYDCRRTVTATLDGSGFTFPTAGLVSDDQLAVAVLPGDATTRVVLARPGESSLAVSGVSGGVVPPAPAEEPAATAGAGGTATGPDLAGMQAVAPPPVPAEVGAVPAAQVAGDAAQPAPAVAEAAAPALTGVTPVASTRSTAGVRRVLVVLLVAALASAAVAWAFAGSGPAEDDALA